MGVRETDFRETLSHLPIAGSDGSDRENVKKNLGRTKDFAPAIVHNDGYFVVVASGPSLPDFVEEIREERELGRPICSVNGSHDFLVQSGIEPDLFVTCDPSPMPQHFKLANDRTIYLLASRADPDSFERLKDRKVLTWHSWHPGTELWEEMQGKTLIGGGTTSGLRSINIGIMLGFRRFILYGMDSCLAEDKKTKRFSGEKAGLVVDRIIGDKTFYCNGAMAMQADEFQQYYNLPGVEISIEVKGDGLLAAILEERRKRGLRC